MAIAYRATYRSVIHGKSLEKYFTTILKAHIQLSEWHQLSKIKEQSLTSYRGYYNRIKDGKNAHIDAIELEKCVYIFQIEEITIE